MFSKKDDQDLGVVPVEIQLPRAVVKKGEAPAYVYRLPGYRDMALTADPSTNRTIHVSLDKLAPPANEGGKRRGAGGHHVATGRKTKNPVDEDGLATPSF